MTQRIENTDVFGLDTQLIYNEQDQLIERLVNNNPLHEQSYVKTYNDKGQLIKVIRAKDPKHPFSYEMTYNDQDQEIEKIYGDGEIEVI